MSIFRTIAMFTYLFGYMIVHYGVLRKAERAQAAGDTETVRRLVEQHIPHWSRGHPERHRRPAQRRGTGQHPERGTLRFCGEPPQLL